MTALTQPQLVHASRNLPRDTSYPTRPQRLFNRIQPFERGRGGRRRHPQERHRSDQFRHDVRPPGLDPRQCRGQPDDRSHLGPGPGRPVRLRPCPWMKNHQAMIRQEDPANVAGRWSQAEAADAVLLAQGYVRVSMDHFARPGDPMAARLANGGLPVARQLAITTEDRLRATAIDRLMCDLEVDVGAVCLDYGWAVTTLDDGLTAARAPVGDGLCAGVGRLIRVSPEISRLVQVVAACFDQQLTPLTKKHSPAI